MDLNIVKMTNKDKKFYQIMGRFLAQREIIKELGEPMFDDDGKEWFIAMNDKKEVLGFSSATLKTGAVHFADSYVLPEHRNRGIFQALLKARIEAYPGKTLKSISNNNSISTMKEYGFQVQRETKNYYFLSMENINAY